MTRTVLNPDALVVFIFAWGLFVAVGLRMLGRLASEGRLSVIVLAYLVAIVAANLLIAIYGPSAAIVVAFVFVGLDLVVRDKLHDRWQGRTLWPRMLALIATGGALSFLVNASAGPIAVASTVAFAAAALVDAAVYHAARRYPWELRSNGSNIAGAAVDSILFPTIAFGAILPGIVIGQFAAKVVGGFVWSKLLAPRRELRVSSQPNAIERCKAPAGTYDGVEGGRPFCPVPCPHATTP